MSMLILYIAAAFMVVAGLYAGQQGLQLAKINRMLRGVVMEMHDSRVFDSKVTAFLESREFYELSQAYRHAPVDKPGLVVQAWEELKNGIRSQASGAGESK